ncbi:leucine-rich repeat domain-containing protein [Clostridium amazonitimonense]|uniref:leucine-rich repeat domain-containing protein n=1 Tax=Clostridium amazonitimonense TaxID=1499689 RepID=UPI000509CAD3|nr:leucine-rich repeat domain-containing protein [Clostridium amazonitimonense]
MGAYYSDGRGRYGTGESYDWFYKYEDEDVEILTSSDSLWTYTPIDGGIEILRYNGNNINIVVPAVIDGKNVVSLDSTFDGFYELKKVVIPEGVMSVVGAFHGCQGLEDVTLPKSLVDMSYTFNCCYSLENVDIPPRVRNFSWAFEGTKFESLVFPQGTEDISHVFYGSEYIKYAFMPNSVTNSYEAFSDCEVLTEVVIEDGVTNIDDWAFFHCPSLLELTIPASVTEFGEKSVGFMEMREYTSPEKIGFKTKGHQVVPGFKIKGIPGSVAEKYAKENGIEFVSLLQL